MPVKPYAEACANNSAPILEVIRERFPATGEILEIASGSGQHAVYFAAAMPGIIWQTSGLADTHEGIHMWLEDSNLANVSPPILLDVNCEQDWPQKQYAGVFSANTSHIMAMDEVEKMFAGVARVLQPGGLFFLYGPFMYAGQHTSESNARFDQWLKESEPQRGLRDVNWLQKIAVQVGMILVEDVEMPSNNRILVWQ